MTWRTPASSWRTSRAEITSLRRSRRSELQVTPVARGSGVGCVGAGDFWGLQVVLLSPPHFCQGPSSTRPNPLVRPLISSPPLVPYSCKVLPRLQQEVIPSCYPIGRVTSGSFLGLSGPQHPRLSSEELVMEGKDTLSWWLGEQALMSNHPSSR